MASLLSITVTRARQHQTARCSPNPDWAVECTVVEHEASLGSDATILSQIVIGERVFVGAGAVMSKDVPGHAIARSLARVLCVLGGVAAAE